MKILFDHNVPRKLRGALAGHDVKTADEMGWATLENGALLKAAEGNNFGVLITGDKNLSYQQNLKSRTIAVIVLSTNDWTVLKLDMQAVVKSLDNAQPGSFQVVQIRR